MFTSRAIKKSFGFFFSFSENQRFRSADFPWPCRTGEWERERERMDFHAGIEDRWPKQNTRRPKGGHRITKVRSFAFQSPCSESQLFLHWVRRLSDYGSAANSSNGTRIICMRGPNGRAGKFRSVCLIGITPAARKSSNSGGRPVTGKNSELPDGESRPIKPRGKARRHEMSAGQWGPPFPLTGTVCERRPWKSLVVWFRSVHMCRM